MALDAEALAASFRERTSKKPTAAKSPQSASATPSRTASKGGAGRQDAPHSVEAEQGVLGSMLVSPGEAIPEARRHTNKFHYYIPANRTVFEALCDMWDSGVRVDLITFTQFLRDRKKLEEVGGPAFVTELFTFVPTAANILYYIDIVREKFVQREMIALGSQMVRAAHGDQEGEGVIEMVESFGRKIERIKYAAGGRNGSERFELKALLGFDAKKDPDCLVGNRYGVRGGQCLWAGGSGYGKSSLMMQIVMHLAVGSSIFGLRPVRPLKNLIIEAENDEGDMSEQLTGVLAGIRTIGEIDLDQQADVIEANVGIHRVIGKSGDAFLALLDTLCEIDRPDVVWIDPLFAFSGCDLIDSSRTGRFLREGLFPLLVKRRVWGNVIHHIGKPVREIKGGAPMSAIDYQYLGFGTSEIQNSFRAVNILVPVADSEGVYRLVFSKRGERANARTTEGDWTRSIYLKHSKPSEGICWLQVEEPEGKGKGKGGRPSQFKGEMILDEMSVVHPVTTSALQLKLYREENMGRATFFNLFDELKKAGKIERRENGWIRKGLAGL